MPPTWTHTELDHLKTHYPETGADGCMRVIHRSRGAIRKKTEELRLTSPVSWTRAELDHLKTHYSDTGVDGCTNVIRRSRAAIRQKAHLLGLKSPRPWTRAELRYVERHYPEKGAKRCAKRLKRSENAVRFRAQRLLLTPGVPDGYTPLAHLNPQGSSGRRKYLTRQAERDGVLARHVTARRASRRHIPWIVPNEWADALLEREQQERQTNDQLARGSLYTLAEAAKCVGTSPTSLKRAIAGKTKNPRLARLLVGVSIHRGTRNRILLAGPALDRNLQHQHPRAA